MAYVSDSVGWNYTNCATLTVFHTSPSLTYSIPDSDKVTRTKYGTFYPDLVQINKHWL